MRNLAAGLVSAILVCLASERAFSQEPWKPEGATMTGWPGWCSRVSVQGSGLALSLVLEASPCGATAPMLTITRAPPPAGSPAMSFEERFRTVLAQVSGPDGKAYHLARTIQMNGPCTQISHEVNADPLPGLHAYEIHSVHTCERFSTLADTRNLNILVPIAGGGAWIITLDHPYADLMVEQERLLRRTAAELSNTN